MKFKNHILLYILLPLLILTVGASYMRFIVLNDYQIAYEGACDTTVNSCFVGCDDDACSTEYYYSKIQKYAVDLKSQCGLDITDCASANICLPEEGNRCSIAYCNPESDGDSCKYEPVSDSESVPEENTEGQSETESSV